MALSFPIEPDEKYKGRISFQAINSSSSFSSGAGSLSAAESGPSVTTTQTLGGSVSLYLPQGITISDQVGYENTDLGIIGSGIAFGAKSIYEGGVVRGAQNIINDGGSTIDKRKSGFFGTEGKAYLAALAERFGGAAVAAGTGITANPHRRSIFKDVALRQFSFNFIMQPLSPEEANASKEIVQFFRTNLYPEQIVDDAYKFPTKFRIRFTYDGKEVANKLLPCYLTSAQTQYNPRSGSFHNDGNFTEIGISLTFQEETTLTRQLVEQGF